MTARLIDSTPGPVVPIHLLTESGLAAWVAREPDAVQRWVRASDYKAGPGDILRVPGNDGDTAAVLLGIGEKPDLWSFAGLPAAIPAGVFRIASPLEPGTAAQAALGWLLGGYRFDLYKAPKEARAPRDLLVPENADAALARETAAAIGLVRDLVNTPANRLGPAELESAARELADLYRGTVHVTRGHDLVTANYPAIHAVGRAGAAEPRLIDLRWGRDDHPAVTLVGKGVCFDSGGLDLKSANFMRNMKKDMGGAATVLGVARLVMATGLPVKLRVLIPAVENAVAGNAFRPGDILDTRAGITVEVGNTDAEGRLILCDALAEADAERPDLLIDCATLTGAARVALGPDLPALFSPADDLARDLVAHGEAQADPLWRLPLWRGYEQNLDSPVADLNNVGESNHAGAIVAALFLSRFVTEAQAWAHIDLYAWNDSDRPGRPKGGEAMALRALYALIRDRHA